MGITAAVDEEAVGIVAFGQLYREGFDLVSPQALGELAGGSLTAAVAVGIEGHINHACVAVAQLMKLGGIQACA